MPKLNKTQNLKEDPLWLTNTLTRKKEIFRPLKPGKVSIYCCGVTVYDLCHLGHARSYIAWDVLRRYLIWIGYEVVFVQNFTDIDDKILNKAADEGISMEEVSDRNIRSFHEDMDELGIMRPDRMPRATKCLDSIRELIADLELKGVAYSVEGDVYFSVPKHINYGQLSGRDLSAQQINAEGRVAKSEEHRKRSSFDFALWKSAKSGEPSYPSPWGDGRPGWHIECSAMVLEELGESIDIHLGGADLVFPHHENEIAQSEASTGKQLARYWLHNGMVNVSGQKMSKSLGNFTTIRSLLKSGVSAMTLRMFVLQAHYRKPVDFNEKSIEAASFGWRGLNSALNLGLVYDNLLDWSKYKSSKPEVSENSNLECNISLLDIRHRFIQFMNDDINTSGALSVLFELARPLRSLANQLQRGVRFSCPEDESYQTFLRWKLLLEFAQVLGLQPEKENDKLSFNELGIDLDYIDSSIEERRYAKSKGDFEKADHIRDELSRMGIELLDKPGGDTEWIKKN
ncbi:cysteine--tRNA ligase [Prochlorococcus sp. MIT 1341]|uniref:cysteine--tRNA ligase n=1 Tax=Prochlorococcus sp. MIT 1341 TaxID=3096221 RepID=UPI002A762096|nr:cysteine--tRNA ligase [Prochlorococcus sp. MIT 1341]